MCSNWWLRNLYLWWETFAFSWTLSNLRMRFESSKLDLWLLLRHLSSLVNLVVFCELYIICHLDLFIYSLHPSDHHWEASHEFPGDGGWNTGCVGRWRCVRVAHIGFSLNDHAAVNTTLKRWFSAAVTKSQYHEVGARLSIKNMSQLADGLVGQIPKVTVWSELEIRDDITLKDFLLDCTMWFTQLWKLN